MNERAGVAKGSPKTGWGRRLVLWLGIVAVGGIILRRSVFTHRSTVSKASPDAGYVATVESAFPPFGAIEYNVEVKHADGVMVRHLTMQDRLPGWGRDPSISWSGDSKTVTIGLEDGDTDGMPPVAHKRLAIDVR